MELRHLRYFVAVAEELHFTRAAERLHIGQPPLSQQIQALEEELGVPLLERTRRKVALTEAGQHFLLRARDILQATRQAAEEARRIERGELGVLRVGYSSSLSLMPDFARIVRDYRQAYPDVALMLSNMPSGGQLQAIVDHQLDIGLVRTPNSAADSRIEVREISRQPLLIALNRQHPLAQESELSLSALADESFVISQGDAEAGFGAEVRQLCLAAGFEQRTAFEVVELTTVLGLVAAGMGIAVVPPALACVQLPELCYRPLTDAGARVSLSLAYARGEARPAVARFLAAWAEQQPAPSRSN